MGAKSMHTFKAQAFLDSAGGFTTEGDMSERTGDKARFHRLRKRKILRRTRVREVRKALEHNKAAGPASSQRDGG